MKRKITKKLALIGIITFSFAACKKVDKHEAIIGTWEVTQTYLNGTALDGPGTLTFEDCGAPPCPGVSTEETNNTSGEIHWELSEDASELTIIDTTSGGGAWNATYEVEVLTNSRLTISTPSIFGELKAEFKKN